MKTKTVYDWITKDTIVLFGSGEYSDYRAEGALKCIKGFSPRELYVLYVQENQKYIKENNMGWGSPEDYNFDKLNNNLLEPRGFVGFLVRNNYIEALNKIAVLYLGSYGTPDPNLYKAI